MTNKKNTLETSRQNWVTGFKRVAIYIQLSQAPGHRPTLDEFIEIQKISRRMVLRDLKILRETFGVPIKYLRREGGYFLESTWSVNQLFENFQIYPVPGIETKAVSE